MGSNFFNMKICCFSLFHIVEYWLDRLYVNLDNFRIFYKTVDLRKENHQQIKSLAAAQVLYRGKLVN